MKKKVILDKERILERIEDIKNTVFELRKYQEMSLKEFLKDKNNFVLASYYLRIALEAVLTIGTHILVRLPYNGKKKDYTQILLSLGDYGVIPKEFAKKIKGMAGYRNRLVHLYWKIEPEEILRIIKVELADFDEFCEHIIRYIKKK